MLNFSNTAGEKDQGLWFGASRTALPADRPIMDPTSAAEFTHSRHGAHGVEKDGVDMRRDPFRSTEG